MNVQTIEQTSKSVKLQILAGQLIMLVGITMILFLRAGDGALQVTCAILVFFGGAGTYIVGRTRRWWNHE